MTTALNSAPPGPVMLDVAGLSLGDDDRRRIAHPATGGVILFARNFASRKQLCALTASIRALRPEVLIAVDHEGGRVQRFRTDGFTHLPAMKKLGTLWHSDAAHGPLLATRAATAVGLILGIELRACDIDLSFTPVLDLDHGPSGVIGDRAFDRDPRVVTLIAKSLLHGLELAGMANCGKHFPGHGFVAADSHLAVPVDERPLDAILADDARPYEWLGPTLAAVMPAHVIYPEVDDRPAGFSERWLQDILRGQLGFSGAIFSDDLSMEGASVAGGVVEAAHAAMDAGCDMVLLCNAPERADALLAGIHDRREPASAARIAALRRPRRLPDWESMRSDARVRNARSLLARHDLIAAPPSS